MNLFFIIIFFITLYLLAHYLLYLNIKHSNIAFQQQNGDSKTVFKIWLLAETLFFVAASGLMSLVPAIIAYFSFTFKAPGKKTYQILAW